MGGIDQREQFDRNQFRDVPAIWSATATKGMVVTAHYLASRSGVQMLEQGGNAIDAAVAASLALSVCESAGSGLGGMGMMLIHEAKTGRTFTIEGPCRAPATAIPERIAGSERYRGYKAIAVPGLVSVLNYALSRYGSFTYEQVCAPAIEIAYQGYPLTALQHELIIRYKEILLKSAVSKVYLDNKTNPISIGTIIKQPELGKTLERLANSGFDDFYHGEIATEIATDMALNGGYITCDDLQVASIPREKRPIQTTFDKTIAVSIGPPAGGVSLLQLLAAANLLDYDSINMQDPAAVTRVALLIRRIRQERRNYRLEIGIEEPAGAASWLEQGKTNEIIDSIMARNGIGETSHLCIVDSLGNWVSMTQSIERNFGAGVMTHSLGFLYNGYLKAFKVSNKQHPYYLRPGVPARSNAAPTMLLKGNKPCLAIGSTGSERLQSGILEVLLRLRTEPPFQAVNGPRLHCTPEGEVLIEAERFTKPCLDALAECGLLIRTVSAYDFMMGGLQLLCKQGNKYIGVSEPRRDGMAMGVDELL